MSDRYDIAIVGTGPAGLSAAINAKIRNKNIILFGTRNLSNKVMKAPKVNNYLGLPKLTGEELKDSFLSHIDDMNIKITEERINNIYAMGKYFNLMANDKVYEASTVILATGVEFRAPLKGELEYLGRGVGYCATCDAPLYRGKKVTVIGYNEESVEETNFISEIVSEVNFVPMIKGDLNLRDNINVIKSRPISIEGDRKVKKVILNDGEIDTDGVFLLKDSIAPGQLVPGLEMEEQYIRVNRKMETNIKGLYAAGDIIGKPYQYIKAAGEGQVAALNAVSYLDELNNK